jgi:predicted phosphodiesterase
VRYLILSDLHANDEALAAVLSKVKRKRIDRVVCLGDFVGYGADPNKVLSRFRALKRSTIAIRGNHDKVACGMEDGETFTPPALAAATWTRQALSAENIEYLKRLPPGPGLVDGNFTVCHGSPLDEDGYIFSDHDAAPNFGFLMNLVPTLKLCFFGHTHIPSFFVYDGEEITVQAVRKPHFKLVLEQGKSYLVNPGSVGQPRDRIAKASYALYDSTTRTVVFERVAFDRVRASEKIRRAGLPEMLATRLLQGL